MLTIRLSRIGKKKKPMYRLIVSEKSKDPYGRALEILGSWNPFSKDLQAKKDRIDHWLSVGATMSPTVNNLLVGKEIIKGKKVTASKPGKKAAEEANSGAGAAGTPASAAKAEEKPAEASTGEAKNEEKPAE